MLLSKAQSRAFSGTPVRPQQLIGRVQPCRVSTVVIQADERLRLHNLSPQDGARRRNKRKGRGYGGHQGGTCGFGTRGQKSRSGSGPRPGFEGGQTPLFRRLPKLRGIAGGMSAGLPKYVVINLKDLDEAFDGSAEVGLEDLKTKNILNVSGSDAKLPLKVLGDGELSKPLTIKAVKFSATALQKIEAAGGKAEQLPGRKKWTRRAHEKHVAELTKQGLDYKIESAKKRTEKAKTRIARAKAAFAARK